MEDLLNWLENARVISDSVKEKITNAESPPNKLLDQLRNGLILVQLAQSLDKNLLQDSINVRPTTEILKEQNFKRFLNACKAQKISIPKPLKSFQGMVLQNLDDILEILFKVSKEIGRIHPKIKPLESIPKIDHALTMRLSLSDDIYESPYKMTRTSDIGAFYEDVGKLTKKDASKTGVENAFDELIAVESRYLTRIEVLAKLSKKITNLEVQGWFFDVTHWSSLLHKFHLCLKEQLDEVTINDFCLLFVKFKPGFTYYCPLIDSCEKIKHKLKTMSDLSSSEFRKAFEDAQKSLKNTEISHHKIMSPDELLNVPFTHIMRYLLMLRKFRDEAKKQKFFLNGLAEAIDTMKDVNNFIEIFKHDTDNMEATRLAVKTIHFPQGKGSKKSGKSVDFHRDFGRLMLDGKMKIAQNPNGKQPKTKYVMGFEFVIFILKISSAVSLRDTELSHEKSIYTKEIQSIQDDEKSLIQVFMQQDSFSIVETNPSKRLSIKSLLEKLCPKVSKVHQCGGNELTQVPPQYVLGKDPDRTNFTSWLAFCQSPDCKRLLPGRITIGVKCCNCKQLYHEHCFYEGFYKSPNPADETDDESKLAHRNPLLGMGHVAIGDRSLKNILTSNSQYPSGTYLIYCNEEKQNFVVAVKIKTEKKGLRIHKYIVVCEGNDRFQLEGANNRLSPFSSFTDLLNFYSKRMKLKDNLLELMDNERQRKEGQDEAFIDVFSDDSEAGEPNLPSNSAMRNKGTV
ncbi:hypothetical protein TCAL_01780 [Tigriopus californicus]|uniref:Calponin-homology (CH) domain-containing protein n=1 Tax=Tigriopus californicus TaxID=6832 RepID=A0A553N953_TIGCA|nr:hypothetical protein TCAL_01780 [Tigriopus californicus]|eukprot:TCALIF_01780-PA protein Name:"Similar to Vav Protein vav (Drosophila melanogaster)" AED:0.43 eAED:0.43 QI:0/0.5/0/0.66/1/0.66/3/0/737